MGVELLVQKVQADIILVSINTLLSYYESLLIMTCVVFNLKFCQSYEQ